MIKDLNMKICISDKALFYKSSGKEMMGLCKAYVDVALNAGSKTFQETTNNQKQNSNAKKG